MKNGPSTKVFAGASLAYITIILIGAWLLGFFDPRGSPISPDEWGDVLAGIFSPLAFLWLLYASLAQRAELELQRQELKENNRTQSEQQAAMERQAEALMAQVERLEAETDAKYEPIIVVAGNYRKNSEAFDSEDHPESVVLQNIGGSVINVQFGGRLKASRVYNSALKVDRYVETNIVSHLLTDEMLHADLPRNKEDIAYSFFSIFMTRLDGVNLMHRYRVANNFGHIVLIERKILN